ncbi:MAG: alpha/beta fold hydrolase [Ktedonobacterales bacterium]|nr:alpha/beta fold hydrolase [Ktedonobacterales bacterium]
MSHLKLIAAGAAVVGGTASLAMSGVSLALGRRFINEFTRPGMAVEMDSPNWGGWKFPDSVAEPTQAMQRVVGFQSADGTSLRGEFWAQPHPAPTIIISHGFHLPCVNFRSVAALEYSYGANIFIFDYRGHGDSAQVPTTCGNAEVNDLLAAVQFVAQQAETLPGKVYIHGFSMGAAVAILMPPQAAVAGIIADSPYAGLDDMILMIIAQIFHQETTHFRGPARIFRKLIPLLTHITFNSGRLQFLMRYRRPLIAHPDRAILRQSAVLGNTLGHLPPPILLIHAEGDPLISLHHAHRLVLAAQKVGRSIQEYYTPSIVHCGSYGHDPQRYMTVLRAFLAA